MILRPNFNDMLHQNVQDGTGKNAIIQGVAFGLVEDFEKFVKVGLLYSNRVVLWDFLWGRMLNNLDDAV